MKVGENTVSDQQKHLLMRAQRIGASEFLVEGLRYLTRDADVREEREEIHPDWIELFQTRRDVLRREIPGKLFGTFVQFFSQLSPWDEAVAGLDPNKP